MAKSKITFEVEKHQFRSKEFKSVVDQAVEFFKKTPILKLPPPQKFYGGGVYAIYYNGPFKLYKKYSGDEGKWTEVPIYVGRAVPTGSRKGINTNEDTDTRELYTRLTQHYASIRDANNLSVKHFTCRAMILTDDEKDLITPTESALIKHFQPLWNTNVDGFGNHDPGKGRRKQKKSEWDVIHPGRGWAAKQTGTPPSKDQIRDKIENYFR